MRGRKAPTTEAVQGSTTPALGRTRPNANIQGSRLYECKGTADTRGYVGVQIQARQAWEPTKMQGAPSCVWKPAGSRRPPYKSNNLSQHDLPYTHGHDSAL